VSIQKVQTKKIEYRKDGIRYRMTVEYGMIGSRGDRLPYFSIKADIDRLDRTRWVEDSCGCLHDEIRQHCRSLAPLIPYHLSDQDGLPLHYVANALWYWENQSPETFASYIRLRPEEEVPVGPKEEMREWLKSRTSALEEGFDRVMAEFGVEYISTAEMAGVEISRRSARPAQ
jgi:hypothetical protein